MWHNGGTGGHHTFCGFVPEKKTGVVVLSNSTTSIDDIGLHLLEPQYELKQARKTVEVAPDVLAEYAGYYELSPRLVFDVTTEGGALFAQLTGQDRARIYPQSDTKFFYKVVDAQITFNRSKDGGVTGLTLHQGGIDRTARKLGPDYKQPPPPAEVPVEAEVLKGYVGTYELMPAVVLDVTAEGKRLFVQITGQPRVQVFPESETKFFYKVVDAQITFVKDDSGKVTALILHQFGRDQRAAKVR